MAIASHSKSLVNSDCFSQVLNRIWYKNLSSTDRSTFWNLRFLTSFFSAGLLAPFLMLYCPAEDAVDDKQSENLSNGTQKVCVLKNNCLIDLFVLSYILKEFERWTQINRDQSNK